MSGDALGWVALGLILLIFVWATGYGEDEKVTYGGEVRSYCERKVAGASSRQTCFDEVVADADACIASARTRGIDDDDSFPNCYDKAKEDWSP